MYLFTTTKDHLILAKAEIESLFGIVDSNDNLFLVDNNDERKDREILNRLAYTNSINKIILSASSLDKLKEKIRNKDENLDENKKFDLEGSFMIRSKLDLDVKEFASLLWNNIDNPKVDLESPNNIIEILKFREEYLLTLKVWENDKEFLERKPHMRPALHPTSLDPRLARACVNIVSNTRSNIILDPFCGSGGFLIEAELIGLRCIGFDLDENMLERTKTNLSYYKVKGEKYKLLKRDATDISSYEELNFEFDTIVSDLPYGRASKLHENKLLDLYESFFKTLREVKQIKDNKNKELKILLILPDFVDKKIINKYFSVVTSCNYYIHRSLSRVIYVLE